MRPAPSPTPRWPREPVSTRRNGRRAASHDEGEHENEERWLLTFVPPAEREAVAADQGASAAAAAGAEPDAALAA